MEKRENLSSTEKENKSSKIEKNFYSALGKEKNGEYKIISSNEIYKSKLKKEEAEKILNYIKSLPNEIKNQLDKGIIQSIIDSISNINNGEEIKKEYFENYLLYTQEIISKLNTASQENIKNIILFSPVYIYQINKNKGNNLLKNKNLIKKTANEYYEKYIKPINEVAKNTSFQKDEITNKFIKRVGYNLSNIDKFTNKVNCNFPNIDKLLSFYIDFNKSIGSNILEKIGSKEKIKEEYKKINLTDIGNFKIPENINNKNLFSINHIISIFLIENGEIDKIKETYGKDFEKHISEIMEGLGLKNNNLNIDEKTELIILNLISNGKITKKDTNDSNQYRYIREKNLIQNKVNLNDIENIIFNSGSDSEIDIIFSIIYKAENKGGDSNKIIEMISKLYSININKKEYEKFKKEKEAEIINAALADNKDIGLFNNKEIYNDIINQFGDSIKDEIYYNGEITTLEKQIKKFFSKENLLKYKDELTSTGNLYEITKKALNDLGFFRFFKDKDNSKENKLILIISKYIGEKLKNDNINKIKDFMNEYKEFNKFIESSFKGIPIQGNKKNIYKGAVTYIIGEIFINNAKENNYTINKSILEKNKKTIEEKLTRLIPDEKTKKILLNNILSFNGNIHLNPINTEKLKQELEKNKKMIKEAEKLNELGINGYKEFKDKEANERDLIEKSGGLLKTENNLSNSVFANENIDPSKTYTKYEEKGGLHYLHLKLPNQDKVITLIALKAETANKEAINSYLSSMFNLDIKIKGTSDELNKIVSEQTNISDEGISSNDLDYVRSFMQTFVYNNFFENGTDKEKKFLRKHNLDNAYNLYAKPEEFAHHFSEAIKNETNIGGLQTDLKGFNIDLAYVDKRLYDKNYQENIREEVLRNGNKKENGILGKINSWTDKIVRNFRNTG